MAGRTSSSGHAHIPEARLDHWLGPAELMFRADVKKEGGNIEIVRGVILGLANPSIHLSVSQKQSPHLCRHLRVPLSFFSRKLDVMSLGINRRCLERSSYTW